MRACEIIEQNPDPTREQVREGIASNLCRCTGYQFIIEAVCAAAARMREAGGLRRRADRGPSAGMTTVDRQHPPVRTHKEGRTWVGKSIRRVEDPKFLRGRGGYIGDMMFRHAARRGPAQPARARADRRDRHQRGAAAPGVHAVITGAQAAELCDPLPDFGPDPAAHTWRCLAVDKVRYVGEGVAVVVADSRYLAEDALALIEVEYEPLPPVVDPERGARRRARARPRRARLELRLRAHVRLRRRRARLRRGGRDRLRPAALAAFRRAAPRDRRRGRGLRPRDRRFDGAHELAELHQLPVHGGGHAEDPGEQARHPPGARGRQLRLEAVRHEAAVIAGMCSRAAGRPVMYLEDRVDNISNCDHHGSDRVYDVELAVMRDGTLRGIKIDTVDDYGAYIQFGVGHHGNALAQVVGPYTMTSVRYRVRAALTNKNQQGAYRGFGSEVNNWMLEQMVDKAARELGIDPVEIRRRNFIRRGVPVLHPDAATSTTPATTRPCSTRRSSWPTTTTGGTSRRRRAPRGATSASG